MTTRKRMIQYGGIAFVAVIALIAALPFFSEASHVAEYAPHGERFDTGSTVLISLMLACMAVVPAGVVFGLYIAVVVALVDKDAGTTPVPTPRRSTARNSMDVDAPPFIMDVPPPPPSRRSHRQ